MVFPILDREIWQKFEAEHIFQFFYRTATFVVKKIKEEKHLEKIFCTKIFFIEDDLKLGKMLYFLCRNLTLIEQLCDDIDKLL